MKDFVPKGTGNSRYLKSVSNFLTQYPDYNSFAQALIAGTLPIDLNGINANGVQQQGTALNKANLLTDATATALGLAQSDPTVNDAFNGVKALIPTATVTITTLPNASVTMTLGSDTYTATANSSGKATLYPRKTGTYSVTCVVDGSSFTGSVTVNNIGVVNATVLPKVLNNCSWKLISYISSKSLGANCWAVGDRKSVKVNGKVGVNNFNATYYAYIIGFNHNSAKEGTGIQFGTFKTALTGGVDIALIGSVYNTANADVLDFTINHFRGNGYNQPRNYGGWMGSDIRYDILGSTDVAPSDYGLGVTTDRVGYDATTHCATSPVANTLMAALPSDLRAYMKPISKYTNNKGGTTSSTPSKSVDYLPLMSEFELFGTTEEAWDEEKGSQAQYAYYVNGNSKKKYQSKAIGSNCYYWTRSPRYNGAGAWVCTAIAATDDTKVLVSNEEPRYPLGIAPVFMV